MLALAVIFCKLLFMGILYIRTVHTVLCTAHFLACVPVCMNYILCTYKIVCMCVCACVHAWVHA